MERRKVHHKKFENLLKLAPNERTDYFIREVVNFEEVWTIVDRKGDFILINEKDVKTDIFLVWTHQEFAEFCMFAEQRKQGGIPFKIELDIFINQVLLDLESNSIDVGVFFDENRCGVSMKPLFLKDLIQDGLIELWG